MLRRTPARAMTWSYREKQRHKPYFVFSIPFVAFVFYRTYSMVTKQPLIFDTPMEREIRKAVREADKENDDY